MTEVGWVEGISPQSEIENHLAEYPSAVCYFLEEKIFKLGLPLHERNVYIGNAHIPMSQCELETFLGKLIQESVPTEVQLITYVDKTSDFKYHSIRIILPTQTLDMIYPEEDRNILRLKKFLDMNQRSLFTVVSIVGDVNGIIHRK